MANPIALAAALSRTRTITCPWCGAKKLVESRPVHHRVCSKCKKHFADPSAPRTKKRGG